MRIVERPDSTTIFVETAYHVIKDRAEFDRVMEGVDKARVRFTMKYADPKTFMPYLGFAIVPQKDTAVSWMIDGMYYFVSTADLDMDKLR